MVGKPSKVHFNFLLQPNQSSHFHPYTRGYVSDRMLILQDLALKSVWVRRNDPQCYRVMDIWNSSWSGHNESLLKKQMNLKFCLTTTLNGYLQYGSTFWIYYHGLRSLMQNFMVIHGGLHHQKYTEIHVCLLCIWTSCFPHNSIHDQGMHPHLVTHMHQKCASCNSMLIWHLWLEMIWEIKSCTTDVTHLTSCTQKSKVCPPVIPLQILFLLVTSLAKITAYYTSINRHPKSHNIQP